jgi:hypothetical protein
MAKTREEVAQEASEAHQKFGEEERQRQLDEAERLRGEAPDAAETEEEYYQRVALARTAGIFGDTDTTAGVGANQTDVPSHDNEAATDAVAQADAAEEAGEDSDEANASDAEARRQVDVAGGQPSAEEVEAGAQAQGDTEGDTLAKDQIAAIEGASTVEEVDSLAEGDERVTVQDAAEKRKAELENN